MNKRNFLKSVGLGSLAIMQPSIPTLSASAKAPTRPAKTARHRVWINPDHKDTLAELQQRYAAYKKAGIGDIFFEEDSEKHFRTAKENGINDFLKLRCTMSVKAKKGSQKR